MWKCHSWLAIISTLVLVFLLPPPVAADKDDDDDDQPATRIVAVDCTKGQSITKALKKTADELIIEISGICEEDVQVRRSNVTLRGSDPLVDGIRPAPDELLNQALNLFGVHLVIIENLKLTGGRVGLGINTSFGVDIVNCRVVGNEGYGIILGTGSGSIDLVDSEVTDNGDLGILVKNGSALRCWGSTVQSSTPFGTAARVTGGSDLSLADSTVSGSRAIVANGGARVTSNSASTFEGLVRVRGTSSIELSDATIIGWLDLRQGSTAVLSDTIQTSSDPSWVSGGSTLVARSTTALTGDFFLSEFSTATLPIGTSISGSLVCSLGADAFCDDPIASVGGASDCSQCQKP